MAEMTMSELEDTAIEKGLRLFIDWLNTMADINQEKMGSVSYGDLWLDRDEVDSWVRDGIIGPGDRVKEGLSLDGPDIIVDQEYDSGDSRIVVVSCTPFHDEGGPAELTMWLRLWSPEDGWILDDMAMEFDTDRNMIVKQGEVQLS